MKMKILVEDFYGIYACIDGELCGMILGGEEHFYNKHGLKSYESLTLMGKEI